MDGYRHHRLFYLHRKALKCQVSGLEGFKLFSRRSLNTMLSALALPFLVLKSTKNLAMWLIMQVALLIKTFLSTCKVNRNLVSEYWVLLCASFSLPQTTKRNVHPNYLCSRVAANRLCNNLHISMHLISNMFRDNTSIHREHGLGVQITFYILHLNYSFNNLKKIRYVFFVHKMVFL